MKLKSVAVNGIVLLPHLVY